MNVACVTIVGTGLLGSGIAEVLMRGGHEVILHDFSISALPAAHRKLETLRRLEEEAGSGWRVAGGSESE